MAGVRIFGVDTGQRAGYPAQEPADGGEGRRSCDRERSGGLRKLCYLAVLDACQNALIVTCVSWVIRPDSG